MIVVVNGIELHPPVAPPPGAHIEDVIAYLRADAAYRDAVADAANKAFAVAFRKAMRVK